VVARRRASIANSAVATGRGDDGTTGLLFGGRIAKDDLQAEAYGTVDEAVAALGLARAALARAELDQSAELVLRLQRELFVVGAELATNPDAVARQVSGTSRVSDEMLAGIEAELARWESAMEMPREFVVPGETEASAALDFGRATLRRAERRIVGLQRAGRLTGEWLLPYVNRLADLLWVLARVAEKAEDHSATAVRGE
jgi:cob(I)alamin adenosyltransferase